MRGFLSGLTEKPIVVSVQADFHDGASDKRDAILTKLDMFLTYSHVL